MDAKEIEQWIEDCEEDIKVLRAWLERKSAPPLSRERIERDLRRRVFEVDTLKEHLRHRFRQPRILARISGPPPATAGEAEILEGIQERVESFLRIGPEFFTQMELVLFIGRVANLTRSAAAADKAIDDWLCRGLVQRTIRGFHRLGIPQITELGGAE